MREWFKKRYHELGLLPKYFTLVFTRWQALLWGASLFAVVWGLWFIVGTPPAWVNWIAVLFALFLSGYYVWRDDHVRLLPRFEVKEFCRQPTPISDRMGRPAGESLFIQLLPKCLTEANIAECRGILTSVERWNGLTQKWETIESEPMFLRWSHGSETDVPVPITLYQKAENRLNVFSIDRSDYKIRPCVIPFPYRFNTMFDSTPWASFAFRFNIQLNAKDCKPVATSLTAQTGTDPFIPAIELTEPDSQENAE